jgi:hypothetical protein
MLQKLNILEKFSLSKNVIKIFPRPPSFDEDIFCNEKKKEKAVDPSTSLALTDKHKKREKQA